VKETHRICILDREIQVKSSASVAAVREIETYINERAAEVAVSLPTADQQLVAILALLNITESYLALRRGAPNVGAGLQQTFDGMVAKIDTALGA
jgi:cell division protein ZapA